MTEIETLKELYAAINRYDIPAILNLFDPQIVRIEFEGSPSGGTYRGLGEIKEHFAQARGTWAEGSCEPEKFVIAGDKIIVFVHVSVRLKDKREWIDGRVADVFTFQNDKVIEMRSFFENEEALNWAQVQN
ncbi:nuclear transport factor 2 family protein [Peredibacter sp. HCB2-198]|uniref:nuclear transport factor 2 family protein n=1 Tax=Peredibacter sp. HCB2-198 TaxID=3383025 RepID=UPI0038B54C87